MVIFAVIDIAGLERTQPYVCNDCQRYNGFCTGHMIAGAFLFQPLYRKNQGGENAAYTETAEIEIRCLYQSGLSCFGGGPVFLMRQEGCSQSFFL